MTDESREAPSYITNDESKQTYLRVIKDLRAQRDAALDRLAAAEQILFEAQQALIREGMERDKLKEDDIEWQEIAGMVQEALTFAGQKGRATPPMNFDTAIRKIGRERDAARARVEVLRKALQFYADENRYDYDAPCCPTPSNPGHKIPDGDVISDDGERAREALYGPVAAKERP